MKVSVITVTWNSGATLRDTLKSVLRQTYPDIEHIIVDGGSTDNTMALIKEYEPRYNGRLRYICEPDKGIYDAMNKGIRMATGDYIGLVHSDDFLYSPHTISDIVKQLEATHADFLYGDGLFVDAENTDKVVRKWIGGTYRLWKVRHGWLPLHPTCYIRRDVMMRRGLYNESYRIAADSDLLFRYLLGGDITVTYLSDYIVRMRMGGMSTDSARRKQMWKEDIRMYHSHGMNATITKIEKMLWKVPQFVKAKMM